MKMFILIFLSFVVRAELTTTDAAFGSIGNLAIYSACPTIISIRVLQEINSEKAPDSNFKFNFTLLEPVAGHLPKSINVASTYSSGISGLDEVTPARKIPPGAEIIVGGRVREGKLAIVEHCLFKNTPEVKKYLKCVYEAGAQLEKHVNSKSKRPFKAKLPKKCNSDPLSPHLLNYE